ncbi:MAG TPA: AAA family ATPase, partial [Kofleriaceae bacterium]|nr:AAA family ATPase [Kofleriaceae bacterium]
MTPIGPVPFVGRHDELTELKQHLSVVSLVSIHGALGSGKSRLVGELAPGLGAPTTIVACHPGDRASAVRARAERALRCVPGTLPQTLAQQARVLVIDDIQHLRIDEATNLLAPLLLGQTALGRVVVVGRDPLAAAVGSTIAELELQGLDADAAGLLWSALEESYGEAAGFEAAFARTRGLPLGLRREFARARFGADAWDIATLDAPVRTALQALSILGAPVAPAGVGALAPGLDTEGALTNLIARQLADGLGDGRIVVHEVVRMDALSQLSPEDRVRLSAAAAQLVASTSAVTNGPRLAWQAGDDGAFGAMDQITRVREVVWHCIAAGDRDRAADTLLHNRELAARSGGAGEFESLLDALQERPRRRTSSHSDVTAHEPTRAALDPEKARALAALRIEIAMRGGRYTEAFERASAHPGAVARNVEAELTLASGDVASARRALTSLLAADDPSERVRATAILTELELLAGKPDAATAQLAAVGDLAQAEPLARARYYLAAARVDEFKGHVAAMRSALSRAHGACKSVPADVEASELSAIVDARRAIGMAREGRLVEATAALEAADAAARDLDAVTVADEVLAARALVARRRGDSTSAAAHLHDLVRARRERGDELGALRAELDLAELEIVRGQPALAAELASAAGASS